MSFQSMALVGCLNYNDIPELKEMGFNSSHKLLLLSIANHDHQDYHAVTSFELLAKASCCDVNIATILIKQLIDFGLIEKYCPPQVKNPPQSYTLTIVRFLEDIGYFIKLNESSTKLEVVK